MDDDADVAAFLGGSIYARPGLSAFGPVPRRGENRQFDEYCDQLIDDEVKGDRERLHEMRRALWATWRTEAPRTRHVPQGGGQEDEDAQLARALAESARESRAGSSRQSPIPILDDDEDAELQRAIAASEEESRATKKRRRESTPEEERRMMAEAIAASMAGSSNEVPVETVSDDEEMEKANKAFQASREAFREEERWKRASRHNATTAGQSTNRAEASSSRPTKASRTTHGSMAVPCPTPAEASANSALPPSRGILGDRAQMEQERLARMAARQNQQAGFGPSSSRPATTAVAPRSTNVATLSDFRSSDIQPARSAYHGQPVKGASSVRLPDKPHHPLQSPQPFPNDAAGEYFLDGELRNTHVDPQLVGSPQERTFSLKEVIGDKSQIALIIMSSFAIADEWMETMLPPAEEVPRIVARPHPKEFPQWNGKVQAQDSSEVRCYPLMTGEYGSAHMKYFWIFYKTGRLRVAISTANMVDYDWDFIENSVFIQDFLPNHTPPASTTPLTSQFPIQFRTLFLHLKVHKALRFLLDQHRAGSSIPLRPDEGFADMAKWDWSRVKVKIVMSVPGTYTGADEMDEFGIARLGKVLNENGWKPRAGEVVKTEFQNSSLGNYTIDWVDNFYQYCNGKSTRALVGRPKPTAFPPIKIVFPSLATIDSSILGRDGGGTMFCGRGFNSVIKKLFFDANSKRGGVLMHAKVLIAIFDPRSNDLGLVSAASASTASPGRQRGSDDVAEEDEGVGGWVYVGSHNFSPAAWGTANLKKNPPTLNVRNYEIGIVFPLPRMNANKAADAVAPHQRPPRPYGPSDVPWDQALRA